MRSNLGLARDDDVESETVDDLALLYGFVAERAPGVAPVGVQPLLVLAAQRLEHGTAPGNAGSNWAYLCFLG